MLSLSVYILLCEMLTYKSEQILSSVLESKKSHIETLRGVLEKQSCLPIIQCLVID